MNASEELIGNIYLRGLGIPLGMRKPTRAKLPGMHLKLGFGRAISVGKELTIFVERTDPNTQIEWILHLIYYTASL